VLGGLFLQFLLLIFAFSTFTSGFALFAERRFTWQGHPFGPREIGYLFTYVGFLGIIIQGGLMGRIVKRFGEPALVAVGFAGMGLGYATLGVIGDAAAARDRLDVFGRRERAPPSEPEAA